MNNKEFVSALAQRLDMSAAQVSPLNDSFINELGAALEESNTVHIQTFGSFEVKKKAERVSVNPATQLRMLVPPKLSLAFKPSASLKNKFNPA